MTFKQTFAVVIFTFIVTSTFAADYYTATTTLNVRSGAGTSYSVLFSIDKGDEVELISKTNNWYEIKYKERTGFASSKYLKFSHTKSDSAESDDSYSQFNNSDIVGISVVIGFILVVIFIASSKKQTESQPTSNISSTTNIQQHNQPRVIVTKSTKSVGLAIFLSIVFPYFGILYSTVSGFFWLFFSYAGMWGLLLYLWFTTLDGGIIFIGYVLSMLHWLISIIWSGIAASNYNQRIITQAKLN